MKESELINGTLMWWEGANIPCVIRKVSFADNNIVVQNLLTEKHTVLKMNSPIVTKLLKPASIGKVTDWFEKRNNFSKEIIIKMHKKICPGFIFDKGARNYYIVYNHPNNEWHYGNECLKEDPFTVYFQWPKQVRRVAAVLNRLKIPKPSKLHKHVAFMELL